MDFSKSHEILKQTHSRSNNSMNLHEIVEKLTTPGKIIIQINGWRYVCETLEHIYGHWSDLFDNLSGISFELEAFCQIVGSIFPAEHLKKKVLLGVILKINTASFKFDDERNPQILEGFDDLDRKLKTLSNWGCNFVILQVKLGFNNPFRARKVPFDCSDYFGIFSATTQVLGMVPIIQFQSDLFSFYEEKSANSFVDSMYMINQAFFDFDVNTSCLLISTLMSYPRIINKNDSTQKAGTLINCLKQALPPSMGGVIFASEGNYKDFGLLLDQMLKILNRIPWPIICSYEWNVPATLDTGIKMVYEICIINKGYFYLADEDNLVARCTCTLLKGPQNVIINTMTPWDDGMLIEGLVKFGVEPKDIAFVVSTNGGSSYIGNNHIFKDSIHIVGHSMQSRNVFFPEPFSEGKPYHIDGDDLIVIPTPGRTLNDVSVVVKTAKGVVAVVGDLFIKDEDLENDSCWISSQSECPILQRMNRDIILNMADFIIPGFGLMFEVTKEIKSSSQKHREPFRPDADLITRMGIC